MENIDMVQAKDGSPRDSNVSQRVFKKALSARRNSANIDKEKSPRALSARRASDVSKSPGRNSNIDTSEVERYMELRRKSSTLANIDAQSNNENEQDMLEKSIHIERAYQTILGLKQQRLELLKKGTVIETKLDNMRSMKIVLKKFCGMMKDFSGAIFKLGRNNQGVPYVANVKSLVEKIQEEFNKDFVSRDISDMNTNDVPFIFELNFQFKNFRRICENIIVTHIHYHVTFLEDFHLVAGKIRGMMKTIDTLFYSEEESVPEAFNDTTDHLIAEFEDEEQENGEDLEEDELGNSQNNGQQTEDNIIPVITLDDKHNIEDKSLLKSSETINELQVLRKVFSQLNAMLGRIERLSLGNPRMQSLRETFGSVHDVLCDTEVLMIKYEEMNIPCVAKIRGVVLKMSRIAAVKSPKERHVEQMKHLLGECDGRVMIVAKYLSQLN